MTYSVLLLGATGNVGSDIASKLAAHVSELRRVAFLTPTSDAGPEKEAKYALVPIERVIGALDDPASYPGFDIVISAVGDPLCEAQIRYADAAFAAGVKHFYPAEYGADLSKPEAGEESYFVNKLKVRKHLELRVAADSTLGYTYALCGIFSDVLIGYNLLGLDPERKSAQFTGTPETRITTTLGNDVAEAVVLSLLPRHLSDLAARRELGFAGQTLTTTELFETVSKVVGNDVKVNYSSKAESYAREKDLKEKGNPIAVPESLKRVVGFGVTKLTTNAHADYPEWKGERWEDTCRKMLV